MGAWLWLSGGAFFGWSLGANDASHIFGTAVASRAIRFRTAAVCMCIFVTLGAFMQGHEGIRTLARLSTNDTVVSAFACVFSAGLAVGIMTLFRLPVSTSQALVFSIIGVSLAQGHSPNWSVLPKILICWVFTPIGAMVISILLYLGLGRLWDALQSRTGIGKLDAGLYISLIVVGSYGAYALGANNIANVVGVFAPFAPFNNISVRLLGALGALFVSFGTFTYGKHVMFTVGHDLVPLEDFTAFITVLAQAITVHVYAMLGVPVSTAQAVVGAVLGIGVIKGVSSVNWKVLVRIFLAWITTPVFAIGMAFVFLRAVRLFGG